MSTMGLGSFLKRMLKHPVERIPPMGIAFGEGYQGQEFMDLLRAIDVYRTKISIWWHDVEPEPGEYDWRNLDAFLAQYEPGDIFLLNVFTTGYATNKESPKGCTLKGDEGEAAYQKFITALAKRCEGRVAFFQRDTEPASSSGHFPKTKPNEYVRIQSIFYRAIKQVCPEAKVVGVNANGHFLQSGEHQNQSFFDLVALQGYYDVADMRLYEDKYTIRERVEWYRSFLNRMGHPSTPIVCTEFGHPDPRELQEFRAAMVTLAPLVKKSAWKQLREKIKEMNLSDECMMFFPGCSQELEDRRYHVHARSLVQSHILMLEVGIKHLWYWNLMSGGMHPIFGKMRLCDKDLEPLPPYYSFEGMMMELRDVERAERLDASSDTHQYKLFDVNGSIKLAEWAKSEDFDGEKPVHIWQPK